MVIKGSGKPSKGLSYVVATFSEFLDAVRKLNEFLSNRGRSQATTNHALSLCERRAESIPQMAPYSERYR